MATPVEGLAALGAAMMMALSPVTGECQGRVVLLCSGDNAVHKRVVWNEEGPLPQPSRGASKACHACMPDKRKHGLDHADEDGDSA